MSNIDIFSIKQELRTFLIEKFSIFPNSLTDNVSLIDEGWLDSYSVVKLVMFLENYFEIKILLEEINPEILDSIDSISKFVYNKKYQ